MKAHHKKRKHDRRVSHQRTQNQRKLIAINDSIKSLVKYGGQINKKNIITSMNERGYFFAGKTYFDGPMKTDQWILLPSNWKRMTFIEELVHSKPKKIKKPMNSRGKKKTDPSTK